MGAMAAAGILAVATALAFNDPPPWGSSGDSTLTPAAPLAVYWDERVDTLRRGETLGQLFSRQGLDGGPALAGDHLELLDPRRLPAGLVFSFFRRLEDSLASRVVFRNGPDHRVALVQDTDGWRVMLEPVRWTPDTVPLRGEIVTSLYEAIAGAVSDSVFAAGDRVRLAWDLADIFAWQVDFGRDLREGDRFRVLAERLVSEDGEVRYGGVLAGDLVVANTRYSAFRFIDAAGGYRYYDADGRSLRRAFLLAPVAFRRISSRPSAARYHPVLGILRSHQGTDFAADEGTPVMASGDGLLARCGWSGGYGIMAEVRHAGGIVTRYGHLSSCARGLRAGQTVRQGETIGFVGSTGLATGAHLHYEFRLNGEPRNPREVIQGAGEPVPLAVRAAFEREEGWLSLLLDGTQPALAAGEGTAPPGAPSGVAY